MHTHTHTHTHKHSSSLHGNYDHESAKPTCGASWLVDFVIRYSWNLFTCICHILCTTMNSFMKSSESRVFLEKLIVPELLKKLLVLYGTEGMNTEFTTAHHWFPLAAWWIQFMTSHPISLDHFNIIHLFLGVHICTFPSGCSFQNDVQISLLSHTDHREHPYYSLISDLPNHIWWPVNCMKDLTVLFSQPLSHFLLHTFKCFPQYHILKHTEPLWQCKRRTSHFTNPL